MLGTRADEITRPELWRQPGWQDELFPHGSGIQRGLKDLSVVPQLPEHIALGGITRAFLPLMQKTAPPLKWRKGVHQLLLWAGSSRPSNSAEKKSDLNNLTIIMIAHQVIDGLFDHTIEV